MAPPGPFRTAVAEGLTHRGLTVVTVGGATAGSPDLDLPADPRPDAWIVLPALEERSSLRPDPDWMRAVRRRLDEAPPSHLVVVSSTAVYEAHPHHPGMVSEAGWRHPDAVSGVAARWVAFERSLGAGGSEATHTVVRIPSVPVTGAPGIHPFLGPGRVRVPPGRDPMVQVLAPSDLAEALAVVVRERRSGAFNVVPRAPAALRRAVRARGGRPSALHGGPPRARKTEAPYLSHGWTASGDRAREKLGFVPTRSTLEALGEASAVDPDPFGMDPDFIRRLGEGLFGFLHDRWFRIRVEGLEHVPSEGPVVLVGVHRGFVPLDAMMLLHVLTRRLGRSPRFLIHPGLMRAPFVSRLIPRLGGMIACRENADRVLSGGGILGMYPEGVRGAFREVRDAYRLGRFRPDFVEMAVRHGAPMVPVVTVGSAEAFPIWKSVDWCWWKRFTEWPSLPLSHGLALPLPLPTRWQTRLLPPIRLPAGTPLDDPGETRRIGREVRARMQAATDELLARRRGWFRLSDSR